MADNLLSPYSDLGGVSASDLERARAAPTGFERIGATLGNAIFGGGARQARTEAIQNKAAGAEASVQLKMLEANKARDAQLGRQAAAKKAFDAGDIDLGNAALQGALTAEQIAGYLKTKQGIDFATQGWNEATRTDRPPDLELLNRMNLVREGKSTDLTKVSDGVAFDPMVLPTSQTISPTAVGQSEIGQHNAAAQRDRAMAAFTAGPHTQAENALTGQHSAGGVAGAFTDEEGPLLAAMAERGVSIPAGFRSKQQIHATLQSLLARNSDKSPDEIAELVRGGQLDFGASKKETTTAAGVAGKVAIAQNELGTFAPLVRQASAAVPRESFMPINRLMQTAETQLSDPKLLQLKIGINSMLNAYDMLAARGGTDVAKRAEAHSLLTSAQSPEALEAGIQMFEREAQAAGQAADQAMHRKSGAPAAAVAAPAQTKMIGGKTYVNHNGQWFEQ